MDISYLQNKQIAILGFGREGKSTLKFLIQHGIDASNITIIDQNPQESIDNIRLITGENYLQSLHTFDFVFKTAGMPYTPELLAVEDKLITQVQFFFDHFKGKVIAITASKGKTTMTSLAYDLLNNAGFNVTLAGNIGKPVLEQITDFDDENAYVVIELSSFMLETLKKKNLISILGSIFPVHLDRHGDFEHYLMAKYRILLGSELNIVFSSTYEKYFSPQPPLPKNMVLSDKNTLYQINLLGEHNHRNVGAIVLLAEKLGISSELVKKTLTEFQPVRHRLQKIGVFRDIEFYDDAISTSPFSTIAALDALGDQVDTLFLGGVDGRYDFVPMIERIKKSQIRNLVLFPDSGATIEKLLGEHNYHILHTREMEEGVKFAYDYTQPGKIALLSTATPSFSLWKDFEEKGDLFQQFVISLATLSS